MTELADLFKQQSPGSARDREVLSGRLIKQGGKDYIKVDNSTKLWGPVKGAGSLASGIDILVGLDQLSEPYVIYPGAGGGANEYYEQPGDPYPNTPGPANIGAIWVDTDAVNPGPGPGGGDKNYVHTQSAVAATWNIAHNLGKFAAVDVVDTGGSAVIPDIHYVDLNNVTLTFASPTSGKAFVN